MGNRRLRPRTSPLTTHLQAKVALVWLKRISPVYGQLSTNILREVCQYLTIHPLLAMCLWRKTTVMLFDPWALQLRTLDYYKQQLLPHTINGECVWIGVDQIFMCGGYIKRYIPREKTGKTIVISSTQVKQLPDMRIKRTCHGLHFHQTERRVYVFGGSNDSRESIKNCEQYSIARGSWSPLPDMTQAKENVSTCGYREQIYLWAPNSVVFEVFTIARKQFAVLPLQQIPDPCCHCAVVWKSQLILMNNWRLQKWDVNSLAYIGEAAVAEPLTTKHVMVVNDTLFILDQFECKSLDLETMRPGPTYSLE